MSNSDVESLVEGLVASGALIMVIAIIGIMLLLSIAVYVLQAVALYKMANKLGHQYPWMAWIPYANTYLLFTLPDKKLKVLAFNKEVDRSTGFWIWLAITLGGSVIQGIFSAFTVIPFRLSDRLSYRWYQSQLWWQESLLATLHTRICMRCLWMNHRQHRLQLSALLFRLHPLYFC